MRTYKVKIHSSAFLDIKEAKDWYNKRVPNLGDRFSSYTKQQINTLKTNSNIYSVRYRNVRCMLIEKFPYFVHFTLDEKNRIVDVIAVVHTSRNPEIWDERIQDI